MSSKNKYLLAMMDERFAGATGRAFLTLSRSIVMALLVRYGLGIIIENAAARN